jgi:hypothetical protein
MMNIAIQCFLILFSLVGMFACNFNGINDLKHESFGFAVFNFGACLFLLLNTFANTLQLFKELGWISYK